jgi:YVTN family beta-propeller protein
VLYVTNDDGTLYAYYERSWALAGKWRGLPITDGVRGIGAEGSFLYVAHGGDGAPSGSAGAPGHLLKWDLVKHTVVYNKQYSFGIDQFAICNGTVYMPVGELASSSTWKIIDATTGAVTVSITGGSHPHNTICRGGHVYMGGRQSDYLVPLKGPKMGPSPASQTGVRPFTINATGSRLYITWTHYRGFSVADASTGAILHSVNFGPIPSTFEPSAPSHGISLSPDGKEVYVLDSPKGQVEVWTSADSPAHVATIDVSGLTGSESPCAYDCLRDGWLLHSRDGRYVYVGDSGDVIDTTTHRVVTNIAALANCRHGYIEVEWTMGAPTGTTTHFGMGY